jgi:hypothetical protein
MACTVIYTNPQHVKLVGQQVNELFKAGKKPTIKDPFITFMSYLYENSIMLKLVMSSWNTK